jgi:hypothetical protein
VLGELVKYGAILFIAAVIIFVIWAVLQRVPADKDIADINWASTVKRKIRLEERVRMRNAEVVPLPDKDVSGGTLAAGNTASVARAVAPPMPKPVRRVRKTGYWIERGGQIVPTAKAAFIEQWALAAL